MPVHYAVGLAGTNTDLGTIPAPPAPGNDKITKIDWINAVVSGASANFAYLVNVTSVGGFAGVPNNSRVDLALISGPPSGGSYYANFGEGLAVTTVGSAILVRSVGAGQSGTICSVQIGYHYE